MGSIDSICRNIMVPAKKRIGFRQKVPYEVLERGLYWKLQHEPTERPELNRDLREHFTGENRLAKAASTANLILNKNEYVIERLRGSLTAESFIKLCESDRKAIITCLLCLAYPVAYDCLVAAASVFRLQDVISRGLLHHKMSAIYGSNRSVYIAVGELLPSFIELGFFSRLKPSVYNRNRAAVILNPSVAELLIYADIKLSTSNSILLEDVNFRPWFTWFEISKPESSPSQFIKLANGVVGNGYLTLR